MLINIFKLFVVEIYVLSLIEQLNALSCGLPAIKPILSDQRIINGQEAKQNSWPWLVSLGIIGTQITSSNHVCGGSLINSKFVLTAAHCVEEEAIFNDYGKPAKGGLEGMIRVYTGVTNLEKDRNKTNTYRVKRIIRHWLYVNNDYLILNDIALLELTTPVKTSNTVSFICVNQYHELNVDSRVYSAGWGRIDQEDEEAYPNELMQVDLNILCSDVCREHFEHTDNFLQICAGYPSNNSSEIKDTCTGDSGGPLMHRDLFGRWFIVGIVSYGNSNCDGYGVYTKVKAYYHWIKYNAQL